MEKTKPTPTLATLYVSQQKFAYALAIYLYLQEKEDKSYAEEIKLAIEAIITEKWNEYPDVVRKSFSKEEIAHLRIITGELEQFTTDACGDICEDFDKEVAEEIDDQESLTAEEDELDEKIKELVEDSQEESVTEAVTEPDKDETWEEIENIAEQDEIPLPKLADEVFEEKLPEPQVVKEMKKQDEELVPGVKDFENNYKESMTKGLLDEATAIKNDDAEKKLQDNINDKLMVMLRKLRGMNNDELNSLLAKRITEGKLPEDLTLAELEELID